MIANGTDRSQDRLALRSRLSDMTQLPPWIEGLAARYGIPASVQSAIDLCLEEALSNVIRHGYAGVDDRSVTVRFTMPSEGCFRFVIEDEAPLFNPLEAPELPALSPTEECRVGGQGIRFLRHFANVLEYEPTTTGNRLTMTFSDSRSGPRAETG
jgi:serine/threonine-protein kinase RsbW